MARKRKTTPRSTAAGFEEQAARQRLGIVAEFWDFFRTNKKWWMIPIVLTLLLLSGLVMLSGTALAPFIYTLF